LFLMCIIPGGNANTDFLNIWLLNGLSIFIVDKNKPPGDCPEGLRLVCILVQGDNQDTDGEKKWYYPQGTICRNCVGEGYDYTTRSEYEVDESHDAIVSFVFHM